MIEDMKKVKSVFCICQAHFCYYLCRLKNGEVAQLVRASDS